MGFTIAEKIWNNHKVFNINSKEDLIYIDLHLLHEVNTPQAFDILRNKNLKVRQPNLTIGTEDHNTPTQSIDKIIDNPVGLHQINMLRKNCAEFNIPLYRLGEPGQGIVHVIAPELGLTRPGMTIACCDSHTCTQGAFGTLAFGIGTTQVAHILATQTLALHLFKKMVITINNQLQNGITAKDLALTIISKIGVFGGKGYIVEYRGEAIMNMSMEARMTLCNMSIEFGAYTSIIAPDETTFLYLKKSANIEPYIFEEQVEHWRTLQSDKDAIFDKEVILDASTITSHVSWGTNPSQSVPLTGCIPNLESFATEELRKEAELSLDYMKLQPGTAMRDIPIDVVFVGSCTNGRIEDLRIVSEILKGHKVSKTVDMIIVPGSFAVRQQAIAEGLDKIFYEAGADFRSLAGCSMCVGLNDDKLKENHRSASTTNRSFQGRQGKGSFTHIVSPPVAAATAIMGRLASPADLID